MQPTTSTAVITRSSAVQKTSTTPGKTPMKKIYKCSKCTHPPFQTKYSLAIHISIKHEAKGAQCDLCLERMSSHHLAGHKDKHTITDRYHCKEKVSGDGKICTKSFKQKSGVLQHIKQAHKGKSFAAANLNIIDKKDLKYISREDYAQDHEVKGMTAEEVNKLVDTHGKEIYVE